jgi:putative cardiolipin synthase
MPSSGELILFSPYFVPGKPGTKFLTGLVEQGVRVRILTNSLASNDVGIVHAGYSKYRKALLRGGVELYELNKKLSRQQRKEKKGVGGFINGQPACQVVCLRPQAGVHRIAQSRPSCATAQH